jgi:ABC-type branched-subunit amino acid transport system substrate-binding protein
MIALNVPVSADPYVTGVITRGAKLAVDMDNKSGGVKIGNQTYTLTLKTYDDANNPQTAAQNVQSAIHDGAIAIIEDGIGIPGSSTQTDAAGVPQIAITDGNAGLLTDKNGNQINSAFGLRIPNSAASDVLATYIYQKCQKVAILHDDSDNGRDGSDSITGSLNDTDINPSPTIEVPANSPTIDTQAQQIKAANPCAVVIWGGDLFIAKAITALRSAGVSATLYTSQQGESAAVRALDGLTATDGVKLVSGRMDSEGDNTDFPKFERELANDHLGPTDAGVKDAEGQEIRQPNDIDFFSFDSVNVVIAAYQKQGNPQPSQQLLTDMTLVTVTSANGDARGFASQGHEAFAFEDAYIAVINDMQFEPVKDEALSASLPKENEILSQFTTGPLEITS